MIVPKEELTQEQVKEVLDYNPLTGLLTWKRKPSKSVVVGTVAGSKHKNGYSYTQLYGCNYPTHRLIWFWVHGKFPEGVIDHINHDRMDNRLENLREVSIAENMKNKSKLKGTLIGEQGIWFCKRRQRYVSEITLNGKKVMQRTFKLFDDAKKAREDKLAELNFHQNHGN